MPAAQKKRIFSGVQPTGRLHIGNYLGAISLWVENQDEFDNLFCVVDMHALTVPEAIVPSTLREQSLDVVAVYLACGIDPAKSTVFLQSQVPEHAELAWVLNCLTPLGWLSRMTQYKSKSQARETIGAGLLNYPVLMAADILLYDTDFVPIGEDQKQHIEFARDLAHRLNAMFPVALRVPEPLMRESCARVMGLDDPCVKMSKSLDHRKGHLIGLLDSPEVIRKAVLGATTDSGNETRFETASPGVRNLLELYEVLTRQPRAAIEELFHGRGYGKLKKELAEVIVETLRPIQREHARLSASRDYVREVLRNGRDRAKSLAEGTMARVRDGVGFVAY